MSINILAVGDLHIQITNPRNRIDNIKEAIEAKFNEIFSLCEENSIDCIILTGDIFNGGQVTNSTLLFAVSVLSKSPVVIYTTPGNHDLFNYNINTYERSSLKILEELVPCFHVKTNSELPVTIEDKQNNVVNISFQEYVNELDTDEYNGYEERLTREGIKIRVVHGMLVNKKLPFDGFTLIDNVKTSSDIIVSGHDHTGYGVVKRKDDKLFINPGALLRLSASKTEIKRPIQVAIIRVKYKQARAELITLKSAKLGEEVLNRQSIEEYNERAYAMDEFSLLLKQNNETFKIDTISMIDKIGKIKAVEQRLIEKVKEKVLKFKEN